MIWQDIVFAVGQAVFSLALVPALRSRSKPPLETSVLTGTVLAAFALAFGSLEFWWSAFTSIVCASLWFVLALQKERMRTRCSELPW